MPRVSDEYVRRRRAAILAAARQCFAHNGFHATSMDDVIAAAEVSPSVLYRWFRGKDELIAAAVGQMLSGVVEVLDDIVRLDPPVPLAEAVERVLVATLRLSRGEADELAALAVQCWAESLRNPDINVLVAGLYKQVRSQFAQLVRRHQEVGNLPAEIDPDAAASPLFSLVPGYLLQRLLHGDADPGAYAAAASQLLRA